MDNLEKLKLVKRVPSDRDRRINLVFLSEMAKSLEEETLSLADKTLNEALEFVSKDDIEVCKSVLQKVYDNLK